MRYVKWILVGVAAVIGYKVWLLVTNKAGERAAKPDGSTARVPGMVGNLMDSVKGVFNFGANPSVPPIAGGYGMVGTTVNGTEDYSVPPIDGRIPDFLVGNVGGVQDKPTSGLMTPIIGTVPSFGGSYYPTGVMTQGPNVKAITPQKSVLRSLNPILPQKAPKSTPPIVTKRSWLM